MSACPGYDDLKRLSEELGRPLSTLIALSPANDPFYAGLPSNREQAEWFADLWQRHAAGHARHIRRAHYVLQAQPHGSVLMRAGSPYENTEECWAALAQASKHARYLGLVDPDALIDRRNPEPMLYSHGRYFSHTADLSIVDGAAGSFGRLRSRTFPIRQRSTFRRRPPGARLCRRCGSRSRVTSTTCSCPSASASASI
jgi:hypothetical protein